MKLFSTTAAPIESPQTFTAVLKRSRSQSTDRIKPMYSTGKPTAFEDDHHGDQAGFRNPCRSDRRHCRRHRYHQLVCERQIETESDLIGVGLVSTRVYGHRIRVSGPHARVVCIRSPNPHTQPHERREAPGHARQVQVHVAHQALRFDETQPLLRLAISLALSIMGDLGFALSGEVDGTVRWATDDGRSGSCRIDLDIEAEIGPSGFTSTLTGQACGAQFTESDAGMFSF